MTLAQRFLPNLGLGSLIILLNQESHEIDDAFAAACLFKGTARQSNGFLVLASLDVHEL